MAYQAPTENYYAKNPRALTGGGMTTTGSQRGPYASPPFIPPIRGGGTGTSTPYDPNAGFQNIGGVWGNNLPPGATALPQPAKPAAPGTGPQPGVAQIQSPITPQSIYTPGMTATAVNQAVASNAPDAYEAMKQVGSQRGISRGAQTAAAASGIMNDNIMAGNRAASEIPLLDRIANERNLMAGEQASSGYGFDAANVLSRLQGVRDKQYFGNANQQISLLQSLLGGI